MSWSDAWIIFFSMAANLAYELLAKPLLWVVFGWDPEGRFR